VDNTNFSNEQVADLYLPSLEAIEFKGLDKAYLSVRLISLGLFWLIFGTVGFVFIALNLWGVPPYLSYILYIALTLLIAISFIYAYMAFHKMKYAIREHDISYQEGLLWRRLTVLPFNRVQHAEVQQGPIERLFHLSQVKIYTAGGSSSDMTLGGLHPDQAHAIKDYVLQKTISSIDEQE
jgi:Uncharacterized conserved protein